MVFGNWTWIKMKKKRKSKIYHIRKKRKRNWLKSFLIFVSQWREFFDDSTFVGSRLIAGTGKKSKIWSTIYLIFFICCFVYGFWACQNVLNLYHSDKLKTTITYEERETLQFPAITMCTLNTIRRSVMRSMSNSDIVNTVLSTIIGDTPKQIQQLLKINKKLCFSDTSENVELLDFVNVKIEKYYESILEHSAIDSKLSVKKCWWNKAEINCDQSFYNTFFDRHFCFSFNADSAYLRQYLNISGYKIPGYGADNTKARELKQFGPNTGLHLLIDFQQKEFCGIQQQNAYYGVGLNVLIHDPELIPSFELATLLLIHPGYVFDITVRPVKSVLNTERIGHCRTAAPDKSLRSLTYQRQTCFFVCVADYMWKHCGCVPPVYDTDMLVKRFGASKATKQCYERMDLIMCLKSAADEYIKQGPNRFCPQCKRSCSERTYEYTISSKVLSQLTINEILENYSSVNDVVDVKKNYAIAKFYFQEMLEQEIVEDFMFSAFDLFTYIGGSLGLFIGISVTSFYELLHQILYSTLTFCLNIKRENKENLSIKPEVLDNKENIPLETTSAENSLLKTKRLLSTTNASQRGKSKNFRAIVKPVQKETVFMKPIITKSVSLKRDEDLISVESEVGVDTQPRLYTNPSRTLFSSSHRPVTHTEEGEINVSNFLTKVEVHAACETKGMYGLFKTTTVRDADDDGL